MNYLAHIFLAGSDPEMITGAIMGDFLRSVDREQLPIMVQRGITHHLQIDSYTDAHPVIRSLKSHFSKEYRRYAGIIIDVLFDHFLYSHWNEYSTVPLDTAITHAHNALLENQQIMPPRMKHVVNLLIQHDVLHSYRSIHGVSIALQRISGRLSRETALSNAHPEINRLLGELETGFRTFFPELCEHFSVEKGGQKFLHL